MFGRFGSVLGLKLAEVSGDADPDVRDLEGADIICTTPEKFDALSRKGGPGKGTGMTFFSEVRHALSMVPYHTCVLARHTGCGLPCKNSSAAQMVLMWVCSSTPRK